MAPTRSLVAECLGPGSVLPRPLDHALDLVLVGDFLNLQVGHVHIGALGVAHLDLVLETVVCVQQVSDLLIVDLQKRSLDRRSVMHYSRAGKEYLQI